MKGFVSPRGFLWRALWIAVAFVVVTLIGARDETRFLSGTPANEGLGAIYVFVYFAFVLLAPALVIGAGIFALLGRGLCEDPPVGGVGSPPEEGACPTESK